MGEEPNDATEKTAAPLAVSEKGEQLIKALTTTNGPPEVFKSNSGYNEPVFPTTFDWVEYARVRAAITNLEANSEETWPSIVEHMTDGGYCFTVEAYDSAYNYSRGYVCYVIAQSWLNRTYAGLMPMDRPLYQYQAPHSMEPEALQEWCRIRRGKKLYEMQIEAGEWAISIIPKESKWPQEIQQSAVVDIQKRIAERRETRKPKPGKFFITDIICPYAEADAARYRESVKKEKNEREEKQEEEKQKQ